MRLATKNAGGTFVILNAPPAMRGGVGFSATPSPDNSTHTPSAERR
ncbi:MAG: hypothetical protein WCD76_01700 [Pyrinomonadaceae bacterium]